MIYRYKHWNAYPFNNDDNHYIVVKRGDQCRLVEDTKSRVIIEIEGKQYTVPKWIFQELWERQV